MSKVMKRTDSVKGDEGAILILALVFIVAISLVVLALANFSANSLKNTTNFARARAMDYSASGVMQAAMESESSTPIPATLPTQNVQTTTSYCWTPTTSVSIGGVPTNVSALTIDNQQMVVWCSVDENLQSVNTRVVTFYTCPTSQTATQCVAAPFLEAVVSYDDYPPGGASMMTAQCTTTCGQGLTVDAWNWGKAALSASGTLLNVITVATLPPAPATVGATYTPVATADAPATPVVASLTTGVCTVSGGVVTLVNLGTCTLTFNAVGDAQFLPANQVLQTFQVVGTAQTATFYTSSAHVSTLSSATVTYSSGGTYQLYAAGSGNGVISFASTSQTVCTVNSSTGVVTYVNYGICTVTATAAATASYNVSAPATFTLTINANTPAGAMIGTSDTSNNGSPGTGDSLVYTYNQTISPSSLLSGFTLNTPQTVYLQMTDPSGSQSVLVICQGDQTYGRYNSNSCVNQINLGSINLGDGGAYLSRYSTAYYKGTMTMTTNANNQSVVTVAITTQTGNNPPTVGTDSNKTTLVWTPSSSATNTLGVAVSTATVTEVTAVVNF